MVEREDGTRVCIVGVGFVGLTMAMALSSRGVPVVGLERNRQVVADLAQGRTTVAEPGIEEILEQSLADGTFAIYETGHEPDVVGTCNVFVVTVGTPILDGRVQLVSLTQALRQIEPFLKDDDLVIVRSTTKVGTCNDLVRPFLDATGKRVHLAMCPERTVEGDALNEIAALPQVVGADDDAAYEVAARFFGLLGPEIVRVDGLRAAELTKLVNNTYRDLMFAYANEIAEVAGAFGVDARQVINAANHNYPRSRIALPGPSGGPCLEKDPWILVESGEDRGLDLRLSRASRETNEAIIDAFLRPNIESLPKIDHIALLGLSFKGVPETRDTRGSLMFPLTAYLLRRYVGSDVRGWEPAGVDDPNSLPVTVTAAPEQSLDGAQLVILLTRSTSFDGMESTIAKHAAPDALVLDYWSQLDASGLAPEQRYVAWGSR